MNYTISAAFVIECEPEQLETATADPLHQAICNNLATTAAVMRAEYPEREFRVILADMIVSSPEVELAPRKVADSGEH